MSSSLDRSLQTRERALSEEEGYARKGRQIPGPMHKWVSEKRGASSVIGREGDLRRPGERGAKSKIG